MLIEFRVRNHRSLRDEQVFTMEAGRVGVEADPRPRQVPGHPERLLTVAGLYGANASGKTNVLSALAFMAEAVVESHRFWPPDDGEARERAVPRRPFAWGPTTGKPSLYEVTFHLDGVRLQYGFRVSDVQFLEEWLFAWPNGKKQVWLERDGHTFRFGDNLKGENKLIEDITRPNALFLSAAVQHKHRQLTPVFRWFRSLTAINANLRASAAMFLRASDLSVFDLMSEHAENRVLPHEDLYRKALLERFRVFLKHADIGIVGVRLERYESTDNHYWPKGFSLQHNCGVDDAWLPLREESHGTQTLFHMALPILQTLEEGGILLVDELERSLHPSLARKILDQFNDPVANPKNAQIIFTTHDTNLLGTTLGEPVLRRDQVWLTEKDAEGATVLYPLTDFKPRKAENIERGYLQGRYGAIPFLGDFLATAE
jgi:predicted ATPase